MPILKLADRVMVETCTHASQLRRINIKALLECVNKMYNEAVPSVNEKIVKPHNAAVHESLEAGVISEEEAAAKQATPSPNTNANGVIVLTEPLSHNSVWHCYG